MEIIPVLPELHLLRFPVGQAYLWADPDGLTLVDTGPAGSGPAVARALTGLGHDRADLRRVVLTHWHEDHTGSAAEIGAWPGVVVHAHTADTPVIRGERAGAPPRYADDAERALHERVAAGLPPAPPARVDVEVRDGDELPFGGGARVVDTPGHTDGSLALHLPARRVLFTGDTAASWEGRVIFGVFHQDRAAALTSLRRLADLDADVACHGHGDPTARDAAARLRAAADQVADQG